MHKLTLVLLLAACGPSQTTDDATTPSDSGNTTDTGNTEDTGNVVDTGKDTGKVVDTGDIVDTGTPPANCDLGIEGGALTLDFAPNGSAWIEDNCTLQLRDFSADLSNMDAPQVVLNEYFTSQNYSWALEARTYEGETLTLTIDTDVQPWPSDAYMLLSIRDEDQDPILVSGQTMHTP